MSSQNQSQNPVALTVARLNSLPTKADIVEMEEVEKAWIRAYEATSGKTDGKMRFQAEKFMFLEITSGYSFRSVSNFTLYTSFVELAISGLTLREGISYLIPYGSKCSFMVGWKGRLEQISEMNGIRHVYPPQVVREGDVYEKELGMSPRVVKHIPVQNNTAPIIDTYLVIDTDLGTRCFFMDAKAIINIRNRRSKTFISYARACDAMNIPIFEGRTFDYNGNKMEPPMWVTDEEQAYKKTLVRRTYNEMPNKLPKHKHADAVMDAAKVAGAEAPEEDFDFSKYTDLPDGEEGAATEEGGYTPHEDVSSGPLKETPPQANPDGYGGF